MIEASLDTEKLVDKVYHIKELHNILENVITDYIEQAVLMTDEQLKEDRSNWIKVYGTDDTDDKEMNYDTSIHTLAIEIEQLRRMGKIYYDKGKQLTEGEGNKIKVDNVPATILY